jgi:hypothetical protein
MADEDAACRSAATVYRLLKEAALVCPGRRRSKGKRGEDGRGRDKPKVQAEGGAAAEAGAGVASEAGEEGGLPQGTLPLTAGETVAKP